jgi:hypothetical protein
MKAAIDAALGYKKPGKGGAETGGGEAGREEAGGRRRQRDRHHHANGKPKKNEKGEALDAEGKVVQAGAQGEDGGRARPQARAAQAR